MPYDHTSNYNGQEEKVICQVCNYAEESRATNRNLLSSLRQRCFEDVIELVETQETTLVSVGDINSIAFVFHVDDIRSSEYSCVGISNCYVIRYRFRNNTCRVLETIQRNDHKAFSTLLPNFYSYFNHDYCEDIWLGITIIKRHLNKMLCKNKADAGMICATEKSSIINFSKVAWQHIKNKSKGIAVHIRSTKTRIP